MSKPILPNQPPAIQGNTLGATQQANDSHPTVSTEQPVNAAHSEIQPVTQGTNYDNIPAELQALPQWCLAKGSSDKSPRQVNGNKASSTDRSTWTDFQTAREIAEVRGQHIGFVLSEDDPFACIDMDIKDSTTIDKKTGQPHIEPQWTTFEDATKYESVIEVAESYTEVSLRGKGVHLILKGEVGPGRKNRRWEVYDRARFIVFTGNAIKSALWAINDEGVINIAEREEGINPIKKRQNILDSILHEMGTASGHGELAELEEVESKLTDEQILERASTASNGDKFNRLYSGDTTGHPSNSEADHALIETLCFYSPSNEQVSRLFHASLLGKRGKHQRDGGYHIKLSLTKIRSIHSNEEKAGRRELAIFMAGIQPAIERGIQAAKDKAANQSQYIPVSQGNQHLPGVIPPRLIPKSLGEFMEEQKEIEFLIDDIFQRGGLYAITGRTGSGKTGVGVTTAMRVACGEPWGSHKTTQSNVLYIAGENPSDVRMRFKAYVAHYPDTLEQASNAIQVIDESFLLRERAGELLEIIDHHSIGLIVIDTDQAVYGDDDNDNQKRLAHAKLARTLTRCPLQPCVLIQCHGTKHGEDLQPRGGSSFINELDGNYCCTFDKSINTATLKPDENKWRGDRLLAEMQFIASYPKYNTDTKGRPITTPLFNAKPSITEVANSELDKKIKKENAEFDEFMFNHIGEMVQRGDYPSASKLSRGDGLKEVKHRWTGPSVTQRAVTDSINRLLKAERVVKAPELSPTNTEYLTADVQSCNE